MEIGIGLDERLGLSYPQQRELVCQAVQQGYTSAWTPAGVTSRDAFHTCVQWSQAAGGRLMTGISVVPAPVWTVASLASQAATVGELTAGRFILGIGAGGISRKDYRHTYQLSDAPVVGLTRDYLTVLRGLLAGERVDYTGRSMELHGVELGFSPPPVPIYLAAMGPQMLRLAGELADGVLPNWCTPQQIAWCRERVAEGAQRVGRAPSQVQVAQYIRVCVDDDVEAARRALGGQVLGYALSRPGASKQEGYRGNFARMGFDEVLTELEARRDSGAPTSELIDALPRDLLLQVGYFGPAAGAAEGFRRLSQGLDTAIVRVVSVQPGPEGVARSIDACRPQLVATA